MEKVSGWPDCTYSLVALQQMQHDRVLLACALRIVVVFTVVQTCSGLKRDTRFFGEGGIKDAVIVLYKDRVMWRAKARHREIKLCSRDLKRMSSAPQTGLSCHMSARACSTGKAVNMLRTKQFGDFPTPLLCFPRAPFILLTGEMAFPPDSNSQLTSEQMAHVCLSFKSSFSTF